jgi:hypothetical protein
MLISIMNLAFRAYNLPSMGKFLARLNFERKGAQDSKMVVYEFYRGVPCGEDRLIGVLPERRKDKERITYQSIMNWARLLVPEDIFSDKVYFVRLEGE